MTLPQLYCRPCDAWFLIAPNTVRVVREWDDLGTRSRADVECPECSTVWQARIDGVLACELSMLFDDRRDPDLAEAFRRVIVDGGL